jgi:RNA polymerase sigma-70 factor (ECF subfamily)
VDGIALRIRSRSTNLTFEEFYSREFKRVYRASWLLARNDHDALEATQEAFARAFARWRKLRNEDWAAGWVITTATNVLRRRARRVAETRAEDSSTPGPTGGAIDLQRALRRLPARQREALVLFYIGDLTVHAVADLMGVSDGTVKAHLSQGRSALKQGLEIGHV